MENSEKSWTLSEIAALVGGRAVGADVEIRRPVPSDSDDSFGITFAENEQYLTKANATSVGAVLICPSLSTEKPHIVVDSPRAAFGRLLAEMVRPLPYAPGIHPMAAVSPEAQVDPTASVGPFAVIERGVKVSAKARVYAHAYVGDGCTIGEGAVIFPHAVLVQDVHVGARSVIHSGVVLGADGFGFGWDGKTRVKVPQIGGVHIGDDVEIGANSTVDRATAGETRIGNGTKLDNLVQVAPNVRIGEHGVIASQTGISGSTTIGDRI
nr:UDP-3-O-(3-hydroxymyristoyl)glucosamine N-acyltransferase [Fimbriimonadaceae bacterium]